MKNIQQTAKKQSWLKKNLAGISIVLALVLFPFVFSLISGVPVDEGVSKFWQGQLIAFFIMAVYAMSYDLLIGYTGILTFGHAAFFGGGAYAMALFLTHVGPQISEKFLVTLPGGKDITSTVIFILACDFGDPCVYPVRAAFQRDVNPLERCLFCNADPGDW